MSRIHTAIVAAVFVSAFTLARLPAAEAVRIESHPSNQWWRSETRLHVPAKPPVGLLVFLPAGDVHSFSEAQFPKMRATNDVITLIAAPQRDGLYTGDAILAELDSIIADIVGRYQIPTEAQQASMEGGVACGFRRIFCDTVATQMKPNHALRGPGLSVAVAIVASRGRVAELYWVVRPHCAP